MRLINCIVCTGLHSNEMIKSTGAIDCSKAAPWDFSRGYLQKCTKKMYANLKTRMLSIYLCSHSKQKPFKRIIPINQKAA